MRIAIYATVPDDWRDHSGGGDVLEAPHEDIVEALAELGAEDVDIEEVVG